MTNFEFIKTMSLPELAKWLDNINDYENTPWSKWWSTNYCDKCPLEQGTIVDTGATIHLCYCELYEKCKFFPNIKTPNSEEILKMWLESEVCNG